MSKESKEKAKKEREHLIRQLQTHVGHIINSLYRAQSVKKILLRKLRENDMTKEEAGIDPESFNEFISTFENLTWPRLGK